MENKKVLLKDEIFNVKSITMFAEVIKNVYEPLNKQDFINDIISPFEKLELKERISWITEMIEKHLPSDYLTTLNILIDSVKLKESGGGFIFSPLPEYISRNGCNKSNLEISLKTLGEFTKWFSSEFAIRRFINDFPYETINIMNEWARSDDVHKRRLASEGLRPKLPWAKGITINYKCGCEVLNNLYYDKERYVTRSVANHLNDVSKINPDYVLYKLACWKNSSKQNEKEMEYIIAHSLRTLIKGGNTNTLLFLGYNPLPKIIVSPIVITTKNITIGDKLDFSFKVTALQKEKLIIDYIITYPMKSDRLSTKVFKLKKKTLKKDETLKISKKHLFKVMTTKKLYSGNYLIEIQINGKKYSKTNFSIKV